MPISADVEGGDLRESGFPAFGRLSRRYICGRSRKACPLNAAASSPDVVSEMKALCLSHIASLPDGEGAYRFWSETL
jgi:hypothetical protein